MVLAACGAPISERREAELAPETAREVAGVREAALRGHFDDRGVPQLRISQEFPSPLQPRLHQLLGEGGAGRREGVVEGAYRDVMLGSYGAWAEARIRKVAVDGAQQAFPQVLAARAFLRIGSQRQLEKCGDMVRNLRARQREAVAGVYIETRHRRAQRSAPSSAGKSPGGESLGVLHPAPEPRIGELQDARAGRLRTLHLVGLGSIEENTLPGVEGRDASGLPDLHAPGAQLHQKKARLGSGNLGGGAAHPLGIGAQPVGHRGAELRLVQTGMKVLAHGRIDVELEEAVAHGVHPIGEGPVRNLFGRPMAGRYGQESIPHDEPGHATCRNAAS